MNLIKSRLRDLKEEIEQMSEDKSKTKKPGKKWMLLRIFLSLIDKIKKDKD